MSFRILSRDGKVRKGELTLKNGTVPTPVFTPVATKGAVMTLTSEDLQKLDADMILSNTYHLFLRPGKEVIREMGGLHSFMSWDRPILTDSGGYQVYSLAQNMNITEEGLEFRSHLDGDKHFFTPEDSINVQTVLGSDIVTCLDECPEYTTDPETIDESAELTYRWAKRSKETFVSNENKLFGIIQGGTFRDLRIKSAKQITSLDFDGYAIGGLCTGEPKDKTLEMIEFSAGLLPVEKPRYLMGMGSPADIVEAVSKGVDMFDCVIPTRNGRNGTLYTSEGKMHIKNAPYKTDEKAPDPQCSCFTCRNYSRAYLRYLYKIEEPAVLRLNTLHNLSYYLNLMKDIREAIQNSTFEKLKHNIEKTYSG